jgi:hypothetical protein
MMGICNLCVFVVYLVWKKTSKLCVALACTENKHARMAGAGGSNLLDLASGLAWLSGRRNLLVSSYSLR